MSQFDTMYLDLCEKILNHGLKTEARNGITYRIPGNHWDFDLSKEFPILTVKKVGWKTAILEIMWIYQQKSIDVSWLRERGIKIWDKFEIGKDGIFERSARFCDMYATCVDESLTDNLRQALVEATPHDLKRLAFNYLQPWQLTVCTVGV